MILPLKIALFPSNDCWSQSNMGAHKKLLCASGICMSGKLSISEGCGGTQTTKVKLVVSHIFCACNLLYLYYNTLSTKNQDLFRSKYWFCVFLPIIRKEQTHYMNVILKQSGRNIGLYIDRKLVTVFTDKDMNYAIGWIKTILTNTKIYVAK